MLYSIVSVMELKYELVHVGHTKLRNQICFVRFEVFATAKL